MGFFSPKKEEAPAPRLLETPQQTAARTNLGNYAEMAGGSALTDRGPLYRAYQGEYTAPMSDTETYGQSLLADYSRSGSPPILEGVGRTLETTLRGDYNPIDSPYYKAMRDEIDANQTRELGALGRSQQQRGVFRGTGGVREEALAREGFQRSKNSLLGSLYESERNRTLSAVNPAMSLAGMQEQAPLSRLGAIQEHGALPRNLEQNTLSMEYQDFLRQLTG